MYARTDPPHPRANSNGLYPLHRVLLENKLGRLLAQNEISHHKDEDKSNNHPDNLELHTRSSHSRHHVKKVEPALVTCTVCGASFELAPHYYRLRAKRSSTGGVACSRKCGRKMLELDRITIAG